MPLFWDEGSCCGIKALILGSLEVLTAGPLGRWTGLLASPGQYQERAIRPLSAVNEALFQS